MGAARSTRRKPDQGRTVPAMSSLEPNETEPEPLTLEEFQEAYEAMGPVQRLYVTWVLAADYPARYRRGMRAAVASVVGSWVAAALAWVGAIPAAAYTGGSPLTWTLIAATGTSAVIAVVGALWAIGMAVSIAREGSDE